MNREEHGKARMGFLSSSQARDLMRGGISTWNRMLEAIRNPKPFYGLQDTPNMPPPLRWGQEYEEQAAAVFWEQHPQWSIDDPRFTRYHDPDRSLRYRYVACSPDRMLLGPHQKKWGAALELKCPYQQEKHHAWTQSGAVPKEHRDQCYFHMMVTGVDLCYFASFDPRIEDPKRRLHVVEVERDPGYMTLMEEKVDRFIETLSMGDTFEKPKRDRKALRTMFNR